MSETVSSWDVPGIHRFLDAVPHIRALGLQIEDANSDGVILRLPYQDKLIGDPESGVIAGGAITSLLDTTAGAAVVMALPEFRPIATLDLRIDYLKPAIPGEDVLAKVQCYRLTRWIAFVRGLAYHRDPHDPIANCAATFMATGSEPLCPPAPGTRP